jgi:hypothetical protein
VQDGELRIVIIEIGVYGANVCKVFLNGFNFTEATLVKVRTTAHAQLATASLTLSRSAPSRHSSASGPRSRRASWRNSTSIPGRSWAR